MTRIAENCTNTNTCCPRKGPCVKIVTTMLVGACRQNFKRHHVPGHAVIAAVFGQPNNQVAGVRVQWQQSRFT